MYASMNSCLYIERNEMVFIETSAKTSSNVSEAFEQIIQGRVFSRVHACTRKDDKRQMRIIHRNWQCHSYTYTVLLALL